MRCYIFALCSVGKDVPSRYRFSDRGWIHLIILVCRLSARCRTRHVGPLVSYQRRTEGGMVAALPYPLCLDSPRHRVHKRRVPVPTAGDLAPPCSAYQDPPVRYREGRMAGGPSQVAPRTHASLRRTPLLPDPGMEQTYAPRLEEYVKKGGVSLQARGCHGHVNNSSCSATHRASIRSSLSRIKNAGSVLLAQNGN